MKKYFTVLMFITYAAVVYPQDELWKLFGNDNHINDVVKVGNTLWAGTSGGAAKLNMTTGELEYFTRVQYPQLDNEINAVEVDANGVIWFGGGTGRLTTYNGSEFSIFELLGIPHGSVINEITRDKEGNIWIAGTPFGIVKYNGYTFFWYNTGNSGLTSNFVNVIRVDSNNVKWIGTKGGWLVEFNDTTWTVHQFFRDIFSIEIDWNNHVWAGSYGANVLRITPSGYILYNNTNTQMPYAIVGSITTDNEGSMWFGFEYNSGIAKYDGITWTVFDSTNTNTSFYYVNSLLLDEDNTIIAGTSQGLLIGSGSQYEHTRISNTPKIQSVQSLAYNDVSNELWIGSKGEIFNYDGSEWKVWNSENSALPDNNIRHLFIDSQERTWAATSSGAAVFEDNEWTVFTSSNSGLPGNLVSHFTEDASGNIWISTYFGAAVYTGDDWIIYNTANSPLPTNGIEQILIDDETIWFATSGGLVKYNGTEWVIFNSTNSALILDYVKYLVLQPGGKLWAGNKGITLFAGDSSYTLTSGNSGLHEDDIHCLTAEGNILWIGDALGLSRYDGTTWDFFDYWNSPMTRGIKTTVLVDPFNNKWIGNDFAGHGADLFRYNENPLPTNTDRSHSVLNNEYRLYPNYPNPFNPVTTIEYSLPGPARVKLTIYDALGREVANILDEEKPAGNHKVNFNAGGLASGLYLYRIKAGDKVMVRKMMLVK